MSIPVVAVIDIGSNSIKVLIVQRGPGDQLAALKLHTLDARISAGISKAEPRLSEEGMTRGLAAIQELLAEAAPFAPDRIVLVATSAVRDAVNGLEFRRRVQAATGHVIRILSGDEEANLIGRGLTCDPALAAWHDFYVFDLGGGSLECLTFKNRRITQALSLRLGCVRLTERFVPDAQAPLLPAARDAIAAHTRAELTASAFRFEIAGSQAIFTGGSMTTMRAILGEGRGLPLEETSPEVSVVEIAALLDRLAPLTLAERQQVPGLPASRADVFPAALTTVLALAETGRIASFHHSLYNLRWGLAAETLDTL